MSFRSARIPRLALSAFALATLILHGCGVMGGKASSRAQEMGSAVAAPVAATAAQSSNDAVLFPLEAIEGGSAGNMWAGVERVRFRRPIAVAARDGVLYVVDAGQEMLLQYERATGHVSLLKDLRGEVSGEVNDIYLANDRSFYLADTWGARVLHYSRDGRLLQAFSDRMNLSRPVAVTVDEATGDVYVADGVMDQVLVFTNSAKLLRVIGGRGMGDGEFLNITSMARGLEGIYVTARFGKRAQVLDGNGVFSYAFASNTVVFPNSIAVDADGRAYVSDFFDNTIKIFKEGQLVVTAGGTGAMLGRFKGIADVSLDGGFLYVADSLNGRIQVFRVTTAAGGMPH